MSYFDCAPRVFAVFGAIAGVCVGHTHRHSAWRAFSDALVGAAFALFLYFVLLFVFALTMWLLDRSQGGTTTFFRLAKSKACDEVRRGLLRFC